MPPIITEQTIPSLRKHARLQHDEVRGCLLLLPERVVQLNETAARILTLCDGRSSFSKILNELETTYGSDHISLDAEQFLQDAFQQKWIAFIE